MIKLLGEADDHAIIHEFELVAMRASIEYSVQDGECAQLVGRSIRRRGQR
jgi:hypothetical protein